MSGTTLLTLPDLAVNEFAGGQSRGRCLQLTMTTHEWYAQLDRGQVERLAAQLLQWLEPDSPRRRPVVGLETAKEHVANALQVLDNLAAPTVTAADLAAISNRLHLALRQL